jgi:hypothetical protein
MANIEISPELKKKLMDIFSPETLTLNELCKKMFKEEFKKKIDMFPVIEINKK